MVTWGYCKVWGLYDCVDIMVNLEHILGFFLGKGGHL